MDIEDNKKSKLRLDRFRPKIRQNLEQSNDSSAKAPKERFSNNFLLSRASSFRENISSEIKINPRRQVA